MIKTDKFKLGDIVIWDNTVTRHVRIDGLDRETGSIGVIINSYPGDIVGSIRLRWLKCPSWMGKYRGSGANYRWAHHFKLFPLQKEEDVLEAIRLLKI